MDRFTLLVTIVLAVLAIVVLDRIYRAKKGKLKSVKPAYRDGGFVEIIKINDDTLRQRMQDALTGLPDCQVFDERLKKVLEYSKKHNKRFAVMILNIDEFNNINQAYGNVFGNRLLIEVANRLKTILRQIDTVSRYAGDRFFFILPELPESEMVVTIAQRIQDSLIDAFCIGNHRVFITVSMGIAIYSAEDESSENLIINADEALTSAKMAGRNTYRIHRFTKERLLDGGASFNSYFEADDFITKLILNYQPYIDVNTGKTVIVRAIPYFKHPVFGLVPCNSFSTAFERSEKAIEMGEWQLKTAIKQLQHWEQNGFKPDKLMIPFTLQQFEDQKMIDKISAALASSGLDPKRIIIDVIEYSNQEMSLKEANALTAAVLQSIKNIRVDLSISVVELGRFALQNILDFPMNYLKIDEKLVRNLLLRTDNEPIITSLVALAKNANVIVIAEGVDFENRKNKLEELGCSVMQGGYFAFPMSGAELFDVEMSKKAGREKGESILADAPKV